MKGREASWEEQAGLKKLDSPRGPQAGSRVWPGHTGPGQHLARAPMPLKCQHSLHIFLRVNTQHCCVKELCDLGWAIPRLKDARGNI